MDEKFIRRDFSYKEFTMGHDGEKSCGPDLKISPRARMRAEDYFGDSCGCKENGDILVSVSYPEDECSIP
jgi:hypothetical protein